MRRQPPRLLLLLGFVAVGAPVTATAQDLEAARKSLADIEQATEQLTRTPLRRAQLRSATFVEERLADGELFYRLRDYVRASVLLTDIVDNYPQHAAYADALFLLSDSLFRAGDYFGARSHFRRIVDRASESSFRPHLQRTLGRLIEIAIHTRDFEGVDSYFTRLSQLPPSEVEAATAYYRAKYLYNKAVPVAVDGAAEQAVDKEGLELARAAFEAVSERSPHYGQARYFIGVIHTLRGQLNEGVLSFQRVLRAPAATPEQRTVADLAQLALGRLLYESDRLDQAIEAYRAVPRTSATYDAALYELAWVYIRQGDSTLAERALEILSVAAPESRYIPDGKILRGNLLLRNGRFSSADDVFQEISKQFSPVRDQLDELVARRGDTAGYFRQLVRDNLEAFDANAFLPALAQRWSVLEGDMERALSVLGDLAQARRLVKETVGIATRLNAALSSPNPVNVFADLASSSARARVLRNRITQLRKVLIGIEAHGSAGSGELVTVRSQRRELEAQLGSLPRTNDELKARNDAAVGKIVALQREMSRLEVQIMGLEARITATDRFLTDTLAQGADVSGIEATRGELQAQRAAVAVYRDEVERLRNDMETGRLQIGVGDAADTQDTELRARYDELVQREHALVRNGGGVNREVDSALQRTAAASSLLEQHEGRIQQLVVERVGAIRETLDQESVKLAGYREQLAALETETENVIGGVTFENYQRVQRRFYDLVLRADVGRIDVSWAEREEHRMRVEMLTRERVRETQALDDEFREVMDGSGTAGATSP